MKANTEEASVHSILLTLSQEFGRRILALSLIVLLSLLGMSIFVSPPVYAATQEELKLIPPEYQPTPDERIERAYDQSEAAGILEEMKQETGKKTEYFDPNKKANMKTIPESEKAAKTSLVEKAQELVDKVTGGI